MSNAPGILISMARCISRRTGQMLFTILATALIVTVIGSGIVRQSSRRIEARQTVLQEIGVTPWVPASHFIERTWFQDLTAGLFFGITLAPALGIAMFALCMLLESIPYFKLRIGAAALAILLLTVLSHRILRTGPAMPSCFVLILPTAAAALCQLVSPTPLWRREQRPRQDDISVPQRRFLMPIVLLNIIVAAATLVWALQILPVLKAGTNNTDFFAYIRDDFLLGTRTGEAIDRFYYANSPYAAEYVSPTQFQPVTAGLCGLDQAIREFIPTSYSSDHIPICPVIVENINQAAEELARGRLDIIVLQLTRFKLSPDEAISLISQRRDLPANWKARCIIIAGNEKKGEPLYAARSRLSVANAVWAAVDNMSQTGPAGTMRNMVSFSFLWPIRTLASRFSLSLPIVVILIWLSLVTSALFSADRRKPALLTVLSAAVAITLCWIVIGGYMERMALRNATLKLKGTAPVSHEVLSALLSDESPVSRYAALRSITDQPSSAHYQRAVELLSDDDYRVRMRAAAFLSSVLNTNWHEEAPSSFAKLRKEVMPKLAHALEDDSFHVRYLAAQALSAGGYEQAEPILERMAEENRHIYVTWYTINALSRMRADRKTPQ